MDSGLQCRLQPVLPSDLPEWATSGGWSTTGHDPGELNRHIDGRRKQSWGDDCSMRLYASVQSRLQGHMEALLKAMATVLGPPSAITRIRRAPTTPALAVCGQPFRVSACQGGNTSCPRSSSSQEIGVLQPDVPSKLRLPGLLSLSFRRTCERTVQCPRECRFDQWQRPKRTGTRR